MRIERVVDGAALRVDVQRRQPPGAAAQHRIEAERDQAIDRRRDRCSASGVIGVLERVIRVGEPEGLPDRLRDPVRGSAPAGTAATCVRRAIPRGTPAPPSCHTPRRAVHDRRRVRKYGCTKSTLAPRSRREYFAVASNCWAPAEQVQVLPLDRSARTVLRAVADADLTLLRLAFRDGDDGRHDGRQIRRRRRSWRSSRSRCRRA